MRSWRLKGRSSLLCTKRLSPKPLAIVGFFFLVENLIIEYLARVGFKSKTFGFNFVGFFWGKGLI